MKIQITQVVRQDVEEKERKLEREAKVWRLNEFIGSWEHSLPCTGRFTVGQKSLLLSMRYSLWAPICSGVSCEGRRDGQWLLEGT